MKRYTLEEIKEALATGQRDAILSYDKERVLASPILAPRLDDIEKRAAVLREKPTVPPPFSTFKRFEIDGNRSEYERVYFNRRQRLEAFAILSWLYGRDQDISDLNGANGDFLINRCTFTDLHDALRLGNAHRPLGAVIRLVCLAIAIARYCAERILSMTATPSSADWEIGTPSAPFINGTR